MVGGRPMNVGLVLLAPCFPTEIIFLKLNFTIHRHILHKVLVVLPSETLCVVN